MLRDTDAESVDTIGTEDFLDAIRRGTIETRGGIKKEQERDLQLFLHEAATELGQTAPRPYLKSVAAAWARMSRGRATKEVTQRVARESALKLSSLWSLARSAGFAESVLSVTLHRVDIHDHIRSAGWLDGEIERLREASDVAGAVGSLGSDDPISPLAFLEKNRGTILIKGLKDSNPAYPQKVAQALPEMIAALNAMIARMRASSDPCVLEAADLLGGAPGTGRRGNVSSLINHAIASGRLQDYVSDVEKRFAGGEILREIEDEIRLLGAEKAEKLKSNKASILSSSIHHGTLDYRAKWKQRTKAAGAQSDQRLDKLLEENRRLRSLVADLMLSRPS